MAEQVSILEGTFCTALGFHEPLKPDGGGQFVARMSLVDGVLELCFLGNRLVAELVECANGSEKLIDQWMSPEIVGDFNGEIVVYISWKNWGFVDFRVNKSDFPRVTDSLKIELKSAESSMPSFHKAHTESYKVKSSTRNDMNPIVVRNLRQSVDRLQTSLRNISPSQTGSLLDIAVVLRMLLSTKSPLLFQCAEEADVELVCYASERSQGPANFQPVENLASVAFESVATAVPTPVTSKAVVFKDWISWPAVFIEGKVISHVNIIREVADKIGAHSDLGKLDVIETFLNEHSQVVDLGVLTLMLIQYARLTQAIANDLLRAIDAA